jgi:hypothetical protein
MTDDGREPWRQLWPIVSPVVLAAYGSRVVPCPQAAFAPEVSDMLDERN